MKTSCEDDISLAFPKLLCLQSLLLLQLFAETAPLDHQMPVLPRPRRYLVHIKVDAWVLGELEDLLDCLRGVGDVAVGEEGSEGGVGESGEEEEVVEGLRPAVFQLVLRGIESAQHVDRGEGEQIAKQAHH
jgi:hypothetical protein